MSYSPPPLNGTTAFDILNRVVVRTGEHTLTLNRQLFDVSEMAECVFFKAIDFEIYELSFDQFKEAYQNYPKTYLKDNENRCKDDGFLNAHFIAPLLGIIDESGQIRIIDGFKRASIIFKKHPNAAVTVLAVRAADAEKFAREFVNGPASKLMQRSPLWFSPSDDEVDGGDLVVFTTDTRKGTPANEGDGALIANLVAIRGLEIIRRRFQNRKSSQLAYRENYDEVLAGLTTTVSGRTYKAMHEARNRHASGKKLEVDKEVARSDSGKFATWERYSRPGTTRENSRQVKSLSEQIREYYAEMGFPLIADAELDLSKKSDDTLVKEFVLLSRVSAAHLQTRSAKKYTDRVNSGKEKKLEYEEFEIRTIGGTQLQNNIWIDLPVLIEVAVLSGVNPTQLYQHIESQYDLLQWASQIFFIRHGRFRPLTTWGEAHQYLYWSIIHAAIPECQESEHFANSPILCHWNNVFSAFDSLPSPVQALPDLNARGAIASICWRLFQQRSCEFFESRRDNLVRGLRDLGFFHP